MWVQQRYSSMAWQWICGQKWLPLLWSRCKSVFPIFITANPPPNIFLVLVFQLFFLTSSCSLVPLFLVLAFLDIVCVLFVFMSLFLFVFVFVIVFAFKFVLFFFLVICLLQQLLFSRNQVYLSPYLFSDIYVPNLPKNNFLLRVHVMRSIATMAEPVSLDLPWRDIDVCVLLVLKENAAKKVGSLQYISCRFIFVTQYVLNL